MDALPLISQVKSLVQVICGDGAGALTTQVNFSRQCPVVSQVRSLVEVSCGDAEAACKTQLECGKFFSNVADGLPVVGHIKGTVHYICGDKDGGAYAMKAASRTTAVIGAGVGGLLLGGPISATAAAASSGVAYDSLVTSVDSVIQEKFVPFGVLTPLNDMKNPGKWFDAATMIGLDALTGHLVARTAIKASKRSGTFAIADEVTEAAAHGILVLKPKYIGYIKALGVMVHKGYLYLEQDGTIAKLKSQVFGLDVPRSVDFCGKDEKGCLRFVFRNNGYVVLKGSETLITCDGSSVFTKQSDGTWVPIREDTTYKFDSNDGTIKQCDDQIAETCMLAAVNAEERRSVSLRGSVCSDDDCCSIYEDAISYVFCDDEELVLESLQAEHSQPSEHRNAQVFYEME